MKSKRIIAFISALLISCGTVYSSQLISAIENNDELSTSITTKDLTTICESEDNSLALPEITNGDTGNCGDNAIWTFDKDTNILYISGSGDFSEQGYDDYINNIENVVICEGITEINSNAFYGYSKIKNITMADTVTEIGSSAFYGCTSLESINLSNNVENIGDNAFNECTSLTSIIIPDSIDAIAKSTFYGCTSLSNIVLPEGLLSIGETAFYNCSSLEELNIPDSVESIGDNAFYGCKKLKFTLVIPEGTTTIKQNEYSGYAITNVVIPNSVTSIESGAFKDCVNLESVVIPDGVGGIGSELFKGCTSLKSVTLPNVGDNWNFYIETSAFEDCTSLESIDFSPLENVNYLYIQNYAFANCDSLTEINLPKNLRSISTSSSYLSNGRYEYYSTAFYHCDNLKAINVDENCSNYKSIDGVLFNSDYTTLLCYPAGKTDDTYSVPDTVTSIYGNAFGGCNKLNHITLPTSLTALSSKTFYDCTSLLSISLPSGLTGIYDSCFENCQSLSSITIPTTVTYLGDSIFKNCTSLTKIKVPDSVTSIGNSLFSGCTKLSDVTLSNNITSITSNMFADCSSLTSINIPTNVTSINDDAFANCSSLKLFKISANISSISNGAFKGCTSLARFSIDSNNTKYSVVDDVLYNADQTAIIVYPAKKTDVNFTVPDTVYYIYDYAFDGNTFLKNIKFESDRIALYDNSFRNCTSLTSVIFPSDTDCSYNDSNSWHYYYAHLNNSAFTGCSDITIYANHSSFKEYADNHGFNYVQITDNFEGVFANDTDGAITYGDLTQDGVLLIDDYNILKDYVMGIGTLTEYQTTYADVFNDGKIDINDLQMLENCFKGNISYSELGVENTSTEISKKLKLGFTTYKDTYDVTDLVDENFCLTEDLSIDTIFTNITLPTNKGFSTALISFDLQNIQINSVSQYNSSLQVEYDETQINNGGKVLLKAINTSEITDNDEFCRINLVIPAGTKVTDDIQISYGDVSFIDSSYQNYSNIETSSVKINLVGDFTINVDFDNLNYINTNDIVANKVNGIKGTLFAEDKYELPETITVTVGDTVLSDENYTYNSETGELNISADLIGDNDVIISGEAVPISIMENVNLTGLTNIDTSNITADLINGIKGTLSANQGYTLPKNITVTIGDTVINEDSYFYNFETGELEIYADLIGDNQTIIIGDADKIPVTVNVQGENITSTVDIANLIDGVKVSIIADDNYSIDKVQVSIGDEIISSENYQYDKETNQITINPEFLSDENIYIQVETNPTKIVIDELNIDENVIADITADMVNGITGTLIANDDYTINTQNITVTVDDIPVDFNYDIETGIFNVDASVLTGKISIIVTAEKISDITTTTSVTTTQATTTTTPVTTTQATTTTTPVTTTQATTTTTPVTTTQATTTTTPVTTTSTNPIETDTLTDIIRLKKYLLGISNDSNDLDFDNSGDINVFDLTTLKAKLFN